MEKEGKQRNPFKFKIFCHHCKMTGHWEEKCWRLHPELHTTYCATNNREWRVEMRSDKELPTSTAQGEIATQEDNEATKWTTN